MRPKIGMDTSVINSGKECYTFENLNYDAQKISQYKIPKTTKYMTLFIDFN
jgi:hypothetical protein